MYNVSNDYLEYIGSSLVRSVHSKVEVDGVELEVKECPKIEHVTQSMIGGFPVRTCSFVVYNRDGDIFLNGREVAVSRALDINGVPIWIPMGVFTAKDEDIIYNSTAKTIEFKGSDRAVNFDGIHNEGGITYPTTLGLYVENICSICGVELESTDFSMSDFEIPEKPNFDAAKTTDRELISRAAELSGCIAYITREGKLRIAPPNNTGITIPRYRYSSLSCEKTFGPVNSLVLARSPQEDNIIYEGEETEGNEWKITNNPYVDLRRAEVISTLFDWISGRTITPFSMEGFIDDFIFDLNDIISIQKKDGTYFDATILSMVTSSRIKSTFSASTPAELKTNNGLSGSLREAVSNLYLTVDYNNNLIKSLVSKTETLEKENETLTKSVEEINDATGKMITVAEKYSDGVKEVVTEQGYKFGIDGLQITRTDGPTSSVLDETGLEVKDTNDDTILFAGFDEELGESVVKSTNITVEKYLTIGANSRFEDYQEGRTGCFFVGGVS